MEDKDNDNIYIYNEETDSPDISEDCENTYLDNSGPNYSQSEVESTDNTGNKPVYPSPFRLMLRVMMQPIEGWKSIRRAALSPESAQQRCFYPLLAIMAASRFAMMLYYPTKKLSETLIESVCSFVSFFFGYFFIVILLKLVMPGDSKKTFDSDFGKVFIIISLSTLCLFYTLADTFPMLWAVLIFLPLWTIYIICRGTRFLKFPQNKQIAATFILCLIIIGIPSVLSWVLEVLLPS